jgi:hypothetical protein
MRRFLYSVSIFLCCTWGVTAWGTTLPIKASANKRYLVDQNNVPWLMVADSAHRGICNLAQSAWAAYFQDRQNQGFNTVDVFALDGNSPCSGTGAAKDGTLPFTSGSGPSNYDVSTPNPFINQAATYGLVVSLDPAAWGNGFDVMYINNGATKMFNFGAYLGNRYKNFTNIIWHTGQDFDHGTQPSGTNLNLVAQLMAGIASTDTNHLDMCQLNFSRSYSNQVSGANSTYAAKLTLDFVYTYDEVYDYTLAAYNSLPVLPAIMGEANYETENNTGALSSPANDFITRQQMWYAMTSGAAGHIFGNGHVNHFDSSYQSNLDTVATAQVKYLNQLFNQYPWWTLTPDNSHALVTAGFGTYNGSNGNMYNATYATASWDGANYALTYTPASTTLTVDMAKFSKAVTARWYDPTNGSYQVVSGSPFANAGTRGFATPGTNSAGANDWVLVLSTTAPASPTNLKATVQ